MNCTTKTHTFRFGLLFLAVVIGAVSVAAQSGRRISKPASDQNDGDVLKIGTAMFQPVPNSSVLRPTCGSAYGALFSLEA
jgi:hypothetical protein